MPLVQDMGFRAREIDWRKSHVQKKFSWPPFSVLLYGLSTENAPNGRESGFWPALYHLFKTWVFGHEKSIGASPTFKKNFPDPLVVKTCDVFSKKCYMFSPTKGSWKFFWNSGLAPRARKPMYWTSGIKCYNKRIHFYSTIKGGSHLGAILRKTFFLDFWPI